MAARPEGAPQGEMLDLMSLPFQQLATIKKQMEEEIDMLTKSYSQLRMGLQRFLEAASTLDSLTPENQGKPIFVPMTSSMYVPGELADIEKVLVDVGTGYYIEKTVPEAREFYKRKEAFLNEGLSNLAKTITQKRKNLQVLTEVMQAKMYEIQRLSQANRDKAAGPGTALAAS